MKTKCKLIFENCCTLHSSVAYDLKKYARVNTINHRYGFQFESSLPPTNIQGSSGRAIRRLRLTIGNDFYGSMRWRIFVDGSSLQLYISSVVITLDRTVFDDFTRILKHTPYEVVGIGARPFSYHVRVNFKNNTTPSFSTRCVLNLDQSRTEHSFMVVV